MGKEIRTVRVGVNQSETSEPYPGRMRAFVSTPRTPSTADVQPSILACLGIGGAVFLLALVSVAFTRDVGRIAAIWPTNAVIVAVLLRRSPRTWWGYLLGGLAGTLGANFAVGDSPLLAVELAACNSIEIVLCAGLLHHFVGPAIDLSRQRHLVPFLIVAGVLAPLVSAFGAGIALSAGDFAALPQKALEWFFVDALGLVVIVPALLALTPAALRALGDRVRTGRGLLSGLVLTASLTVVFAQSSYPILFLIPPALILVAFELHLAGAALALLVTSLVAVVMTLTGHGPATLVHGPLAERLSVLQLFLATMTLVVLPVAATLAERRRLENDLRTSLDATEAARARIEESEARLRMIADNATDIITRMGLDGRVTFFSPSVTDVTGYAVDEVTGASMIPLLHPDDVEPTLAAYRALIAGEQLDEAVAYRIRHKSGRWISLEGRPRLVRDAAGAPSEIIDVRHDVTSRVLLEVELRAARDAAEASAAIKSDFMANMSHEIRTPLTAIIGFTSLLAGRSDLHESAQTHVKRVAGAGQALLAIVTDILDFSKLEAGQVEIKPRPVAPEAVLAAALQLFAPQATAKNLALLFEIEGELPPGLQFDPDRVRQILLNLIGNAIKFTDAGFVRVVAAYDATAGQLEVRVEDSGPGLTRAQQRKLFQRFSQVDDSTTRRHGGTGLGLAISKGLAEAMGGAISVRSRRGQGSAFYFRIDAPVAEILAPATLSPDEALLDGVRLLVADDNSVNRELVRAILTPLGVEVTDAIDGRTAVETALSTPFDVILMDIRMPGLDGPAAAAEIRSGADLYRDTPILAFTADIDVTAFEAGASVFDGVVSKPISPSELVTALSNCLQWDETGSQVAAAS